MDERQGENVLSHRKPQHAAQCLHGVTRWRLGKPGSVDSTNRARGARLGRTPAAQSGAGCRAALELQSDGVGDR
jgi:hypothetical protein